MHTIEIQPKIESARSSPQPFSKSHFAPAFYLLAPKRRRALKLLYAVLRVLDDAVDVGTENPRSFLEAWREVFVRKSPIFVSQLGYLGLAKDFLEVVQRFDIPLFALLDFIDKGLEMDLNNNQRFETPMDTENYCYGVAGTVGLACLPIFGVPWQEAKDYAIRLGITVQWINMVRDVGVDAKIGRIYLPLEHLEQFGCKQEGILARQSSPEFEALIKHEASVARAHYRRAMDLLPPRWEKELLPARLMGKIYIKLLEKLEKKDFPVLTRAVKLNAWEKGVATWQTLRG